jgi:cell division protease FtsH
VWVGLAVVAFVLVQRLGGRGHGPLRFTYSKVLDLAQEKPSRIKDLKVNTKGVGQGHLTDGAAFTVNLPPDPLPYAKTLADSGVQLEFLTPTISDVWVGGLLSVLAALALIVVFWFLLMRQTQSGGSQALSFGRSRARRWADVGQKVTFDDIGGVDEAKHELMEVVDFLKNPKKFAAVGARIPKGVLLLGPPGAGKTLLARAIAGEAGVPFFHMSGSEFVEMFVGVGASRVRDLFEQAKANRPCIVFIDEIDAVGRQRFAGLGGGHDEREQTLNQLLVEMDGFEHNSGVILIAATNRPDVLDPALLRPGRFDRRIVVDHADLKGREAILKLYVKGKPLAEDVDVNLLARRTPGFSGADIANMANEAALLAARRDLPKVAMREFEEAIDRVVAGPERKSRIISDREKQILAHHEIGHALLAELLPDADPVHKASILQRGLALGYTMQLPLEDKYIVRKKELLDQITVALGGRAVEELTFQELTTGAADDLERATDLARRMVTQFGMSEELGPLSLGRKFQPPFLGRDIMEDRNYSEQVASAIDKEISTIIAGCYAKGKQLLTEHSEEVRALVTVLLERETLTGEEIRAILKGEPLPARPDGPEKPAAPGPEIVGKTPEPRAKPAEGFQPT